MSGRWGLARRSRPTPSWIEQILVTDGSTPGAASGPASPFFLRFDSAEISDTSDGEPLGYLLENRHIRAALAQAILAAGIEVLAPAKVASAAFGPREAVVTLADGRTACARRSPVKPEGRGSVIRT